MLTVPQAAARTGHDPETIRRWIRSGRLRASKVGTQHVIEEDDLDALIGDDSFPLPEAWRTTHAGGTPIDAVSAIRRSRRGR